MSGARRRSRDCPLIDGGIRLPPTRTSYGVVHPRLFERHQLSGPELAVFGDGPVEIRLARAAGAIAVGVAASPARDSKPDPARRARLIRAGAHLIVPDFSDLPALEGFLWGS